MTKTISAAANPALANKLLEDTFSDEQISQIDPTILPPSDNTVELPGGYITPTGELLRTAEVRELNGKDEEAISKASTLGKALLIILERGTVSLGGQKVTEGMLNHMLAADRETLLLAILKHTFGKDVDIAAFCSGCNDFKTVTVDVNTDVKIKMLTDPIEDRVFFINGTKDQIKVQLPTGVAQKELIVNADKSAAELNTILLEKTVLEINGAKVFGKLQVQNLSITDRKKTIDQINEKSPGPQFNNITVECPDCESEVTVSINLGNLFQF
jgi:hypothetical protein